MGLLHNHNVQFGQERWHWHLNKIPFCLTNAMIPFQGIHEKQMDSCWGSDPDDRMTGIRQFLTSCALMGLYELFKHREWKWRRDEAMSLSSWPPTSNPIPSWPQRSRTNASTSRGSIPQRRNREKIWGKKRRTRRKENNKKLKTTVIIVNDYLSTEKCETAKKRGRDAEKNNSTRDDGGSFCGGKKMTNAKISRRTHPLIPSVTAKYGKREKWEWMWHAFIWRCEAWG